MEPSPNKDLSIVLVQPSKHEAVRSLFTFHKNEGLGHKPPIGILTLATHLIAQGFTNTRCLDAQLDDLSPEQTAQRLADAKPDVVGFTAWSEFWYPTWKTINLTRERLPQCKLIVGGPQCLVYPGETLEHSDADYVVAGDGEDTLTDLVHGLASGRPIPDLPGLWRKEARTIKPPTIEMAVAANLDDIPGPDRTLLPHTRYNSVLNPHDHETTMVTSRGCPFKCVFCKIHAQKVNSRAVERVVDEFRDIAALGITDVQVYDDTFTWSRQRAIDICNGILRSGIKIRWAVRDRVNKADPELYALMRKAGCYRIHFGVESGSETVLAASGKNITLEQVNYAIRTAHQAGFTTLAYYMFGFLDETYADALRTIDFAIKAKSDYAVFAVLIPYPGTELYSSARARGIIPYDFWAEFTKHPVPDFDIPHLIEQHMDRRTLINLRDKALRRFYFRPRRIWWELARLRSYRELREKTKMGLNIVTDSLDSIFRNVLRASEG